MKKILIALLLLASPAYADNSKIEVRGSIDDGTSTLQDTGLITKYFTSGARQSNAVTLTANAFTNIAVPQTADAVLIDVGSTRSLTLRAISSATGITLDSSCPVLLPLSSDNVTFGLFNANSENKTIRVYFF